MVKQDNKTILKIIGIVAVVAIAYMIFGNSGSQTAPATIEIKQPGQSAQPGTIVVQPAATPNVPTTGTINFRLSSSAGTTPTGTSSNLLLLDNSYAVLTNGKFDVMATKYKIMKEIADNGVNSLKYYTGTAKTLTHSSGIWSDTITGLPGNQGIAFSYYDTTPAKTDNRSYVKQFTLNKFNPSTAEWYATLNDGSDRWSLNNYGDYNFSDTTQTVKVNYTLADGGTQLSNQVVTWQTFSNAVGEECVDCAVLVVAPDNYTSKFRDLTLTARSTKGSGDASVKFTQLPLASTYGDTIGITYQAISNTGTSANDHVRFAGYIPSNFNTLRTTSDKNQLTWTLTTDTYGTSVLIYFYIVQNAHALGTNNGAFVQTQPFPVWFSPDAVANTGFNTRQQTT